MFENVRKKIGDIAESGLKKLEAPITSVPIMDRKILQLPDSIILEKLEKTIEMEKKGRGDESFIFALEMEIEKFQEIKSNLEEENENI